MIVELTGRTVGEKCSVCHLPVTERDGAEHVFDERHLCTCSKKYLNWHGASGPGLQFRQIIGTAGAPKDPRPGIHEICEQMQSEGFYLNHDRSECKFEIARRYEARSVMA